MISPGAINESVGNMRKWQVKVKQAEAALNAEVERIKKDNAGHPSYIAEKVKEARAKALPGIVDAVSAAQKEHDVLMNHAQFYKSKAFLLSQKPLTEPLNGIYGAPAKDQGIEATARMAKIAELSKLSNDMLTLAASNAKLEGRLGELHLIATEQNSRNPKEPIPLDDVNIPEQGQANELFKNAGEILGDMQISMHDVSGNPLSPIQRINAVRGVLNAPAPSMETSIGNPQARLTAART